MKILVFAPHNDDEVLGVGGTIAKYVREGHEVYVCEVTKSASIERLRIIREEAMKAHNLLGISQTFFLDFPVVKLNEIPIMDLNAEFTRVIDAVKPDIAFIPHRGDMHRDHLVVSHCAMVAMRPIGANIVKEIYAYETLSETEWNIPSVENAFIPNVWVDISEYIDIKLEAMSCYKSQLMQPPHPRSNEIIKALASVRGSTVNAKFAESFMLIRKITN